MLARARCASTRSSSSPTKPALRELSFEPATFEAAMQAEESLRAVREDVEEGSRLGLTQTPMIFVDGVELRGWSAPDALAQAVRAAVEHPAPDRADAAADR